MAGGGGEGLWLRLHKTLYDQATKISPVFVAVKTWVRQGRGSHPSGLAESYMSSE